MNYRTKSKIRRVLAIVMLALVFILLVMMPVTGVVMAETIDEITPDVVATVLSGETDVGWLKTFMNEAIIALCLAIGLLYKHCTSFKRKYIPLVVAVIGVIAAVAIHWSEGITMLVFIEGIWSGLASTGLHQLVTKLFYIDET